MKKIMFVIKRVVLALVMLYSVNLITTSTGVFLPINIFSVGLVSLLGIPSIFGLFILKLFL